MNRRHTEKTGKWAEIAAVMLLRLRGFKIVARRYRPPHRGAGYGEIDIIAKRNHLIVFVEVKLRKNGQEDAINALTPRQQKRITKTARLFLAQQENVIAARFDAIFFGGRRWPLYIANAWQDEGN